MKKIILAALFYMTVFFATAQIYVAPIIKYESFPGACDASVQYIPYGTTGPYTIVTAASSTFMQSNGFYAENICADGLWENWMSASVIDANCHEFGMTFRIIPYSTYPPPVLDTIIITYPTMANNDGAIELHFHNIPSICTRNLTFDCCTNYPNDSVFTGLAEGNYSYNITLAGNPYFSVSIPLYSGVNSPCDWFKTEVSSTDLTYDYTVPNSSCDNSFVVQNTGCDPDMMCDGSVTMSGSDADTSDYWFWGIGGNGNYNYFYNTQSTYATCLCRGHIAIYGLSDLYTTYNQYYTYTTRFIGDTEDSSYKYIWNMPDTIPPNTDTLVLNALDIPALHYYLPPDTAYIDYIEELDSGQYEITTAIIQQTDSVNIDTVYLHNLAFLDTTFNYVFDITTFEGDSLICDVVDMMRNIIYYSFPDPPAPEDTCYTGNGGGHHHHGNGHGYGHGNGHEHTGPCEEEEMRNAWVEGKAATNSASIGLNVFPNPFSNELNIISTTIIARVEVYGIDGKLKKQAVVNAGNCTLGLSELEPASYIIKIYDPLGKTAFARVIKTQ